MATLKNIIKKHKAFIITLITIGVVSVYLKLRVYDPYLFSSGPFLEFTPFSYIPESELVGIIIIVSILISFFLMAKAKKIRELHVRQRIAMFILPIILIWNVSLFQDNVIELVRYFSQYYWLHDSIFIILSFSILAIGSYLLFRVVKGKHIRKAFVYILAIILFLEIALLYSENISFEYCPPQLFDIEVIDELETMELLSNDFIPYLYKLWLIDVCPPPPPVPYIPL